MNLGAVIRISRSGGDGVMLAITLSPHSALRQPRYDQRSCRCKYPQAYGHANSRVKGGVAVAQAVGRAARAARALVV